MEVRRYDWVGRGHKRRVEEGKCGSEHYTEKEHKKPRTRYVPVMYIGWLLFVGA